MTEDSNVQTRFRIMPQDNTVVFIFLCCLCLSCLICVLHRPHNLPHSPICTQVCLQVVIWMPSCPHPKGMCESNGLLGPEVHLLSSHISVSLNYFNSLVTCSPIFYSCLTQAFPHKSQGNIFMKIASTHFLSENSPNNFSWKSQLNRLCTNGAYPDPLTKVVS